MDDDTSGETAMSYTNPVLLRALLASIVRDAGVSPADITVYDVSRLFPDYMVEMCTQGDLHGVNFVGRNNGVADENAPILWSREFSGRVNYLPTCVTEAKYVINLANLKGHSYGITLCGKNHFGSFINGDAMRPPEGANLHQWLTQNEMGIYSPLSGFGIHMLCHGLSVYYIVCYSLSDPARITPGFLGFIQGVPSLQSYADVFAFGKIPHAFMISVLRCICSPLLMLAVTLPASGKL